MVYHNIRCTSTVDMHGIVLLDFMFRLFFLGEVGNAPQVREPNKNKLETPLTVNWWHTTLDVNRRTV